MDSELNDGASQATEMRERTESRAILNPPQYSTKKLDIKNILLAASVSISLVSIIISIFAFSKNAKTFSENQTSIENLNSEIKELKSIIESYKLTKVGSTISFADSSIILNDDDPTNEIQNITQDGSTVTLSNGGGTILLSDNDPTNELQNLSQNGGIISLSNGGGAITLNDNNSTNEIQQLSSSNFSYSLTDGGSVAKTNSWCWFSLNSRVFSSTTPTVIANCTSGGLPGNYFIIFSSTIEHYVGTNLNYGDHLFRLMYSVNNGPSIELTRAHSSTPAASALGYYRTPISMNYLLQNIPSGTLTITVTASLFTVGSVNGNSLYSNMNVVYYPN